ncbi:MAG: hypothetical protein KF773_24905 [Deltaproteobacteria bacterium]|nr:hypothetical protein [Deltaproteobacteria bacterium]
MADEAKTEATKEPTTDAKPEAKKAAPKQATTTQQVAMLVGAFVALANVAFYFLSDLYFADKATDLLKANRYDAGAMANVRIAFAAFTVAVGGASVLASYRAKLVGHGLAAAAGVASLAAAFGALGRDMPLVLPVTLLVLGGTLPALAYYSMQKRARSAWSFLIAICGVFGLVLLFGAPKVRGLLGMSLWTALIIPGLLAVATVALSLVRNDYQEA